MPQAGHRKGGKLPGVKLESPDLSPQPVGSESKDIDVIELSESLPVVKQLVPTKIAAAESNCSVADVTLPEETTLPPIRERVVTGTVPYRSKGMLATLKPSKSEGKQRTWRGVDQGMSEMCGLKGIGEVKEHLPPIPPEPPPLNYNLRKREVMYSLKTELW